MHGALNISNQRFDEVFDQARAAVKAQLGNTASSHSRLQYFQRMLEMVGMKSDVVAALDYEQTYWRTFLSCASLFPNAKSALLLIRSLDIPLVLVTDLNSRIQFRKVVYFELETVFDYVVTSEEVGADKPDARIFHTAMSKLGLDNQQPVWVLGDDVAKDGIGSKTHLNATFMLRQPRPMSSEEAIDVQFDDFGELEQLITKVSGGWK
jgi:putative hydrolase of the HAD superfamily